MLYKSFRSYVKPFFLSVGLEIIGGENILDFYIDASIQSIYNYKDWSFTNYVESIDGEEGKDKKGTTIYKYRLRYKYRKFHYVNSYGEKLFIDTDFFVGSDDRGVYIYTYVKYDTLEVSYYIAYEWNKARLEEGHIPLPDDFIPVLTNKVYDFGSPLSENDGSNMPRYQIAERELGRLSDIDMKQEGGFIFPNT